MRDGIVVCVTGGSGFCGSHICRLLGENKLVGKSGGVKEVRVLDFAAPSGKQFELWQSVSKQVRDQNAVPLLKFMQGSICDVNVCHAAFDGCDVVIHGASLVDFGNRDPEQVAEVNVKGTATVIAACLRTNVKALIYTSSSDCLNTWGDMINVKSTAPYPKNIDDNASGVYGYTKSVAEKLALDANGGKCADGSTKLATVSLRPRGIYGEGDTYYFVSVVKASAGMPVRVGTENKLIDHMYVGNVAYAHICAINLLLSSDEKEKNRIAGKGLNISHEPPKPLYEKVKPILSAFKIQVPHRALPINALWFIAVLVQLLLWPIPRSWRPTVLLTTQSIDAVTSEKTFTDQTSLDALGFKPLFSVEEAYCRTIDWMTQEWPDRPNMPKPNSAFRSSIIWTVVCACIARGAIFYTAGY